MNKIIIISDNILLSHELEVINYFNSLEGITIYYCLINLSISSRIDKKKFTNIIFINKNNISKLRGNFVFFNYIPNDNLDIYSYNNIFFFIGNIKNVKKVINTKIKRIMVFNFFRLKFVNNIFNSYFINSKVINIFNINYPSGIAGIVNNGAILTRKLNNVFFYDIVIILGGGLDIKLINKLLEYYIDKKILIIGKNHPHNLIEKNKKIILSWNNYKNVFITNMLTEKKLFINIYFSKFVLLPLKNNINTDITRISDSLFVGKIIFTTKNKATLHIDKVIFCKTLKDFIENINKSFKENIYRNEDLYKKIVNYYMKNFRIELLLKKLIENI